MFQSTCWAVSVPYLKGAAGDQYGVLCFFGWLYLYTGARLIFGISFMLFCMAFLLALSLQSLISPSRRVHAEQKEFIGHSQ